MGLEAMGVTIAMVPAVVVMHMSDTCTHSRRICLVVVYLAYSRHMYISLQDPRKQAMNMHMFINT